MKVLNIALLTVGIILLAGGYFPWLTRHESVEIRSARNMMTVLAGWALTVMGYLGMLITCKSSGRQAQEISLEKSHSRANQ